MQARFSAIPAVLIALILPSSLTACSDDPGTGDDTTIGADTSDDDTTDSDDTTLSDVTPDSTQPDTRPPVDTTPRPDTIPAPDVVVDESNCSPAGGWVNIYDLQNPDCADHPNPEPVGTNGMDVELQGVVVTGTFGDTMFVQDPKGGPFSGIAVYNNTIFVDDLLPGTVLNIEGQFSEFYETSQIYLQEFNVTSTGPAPDPFVIEFPHWVATNGPLAEAFEGVFIQVQNVATTHTQPDCPKDYGEFEVTGGLRIDDMAFKWDARVGDEFTSISGPLQYSFGNHKIEPRSEADLVWTTKGPETGISKCIAAECQAPDNAPTTKTIVVTEVMPDPFGDDTNKEWIELYNPGSQAVDITDWEIRDCGDQRYVIGGVNLTVQPGGFLVLGAHSNFTLNGGVPVDHAYGNENFYLANTVGAVLLYDGPGFQANLVDQIRYSRFEPWDQLSAGSSLERRSPTNDGTQSTSWSSGWDGGSPGRNNDDW